MFACLRCGLVHNTCVTLFAQIPSVVCFVNEFAWDLYFMYVSYVCVEYDVGNQGSVIFHMLQPVLYLFVNVGSYIILFHICMITCTFSEDLLFFIYFT